MQIFNIFFRKGLGTFLRIHYMEILGIKSSKKVARNFSCKCCDYTTSRKSNFDKHELSRRHTKMSGGDVKVAKSSKKVANNFTCDCGNVYKYNQGLWRHRKTCIEKKEQVIATDNTLVPCEFLMGMFKEMLKNQNEQMMELFKNGVGNTNCNNTTNKIRFNINLFLNEKCKDAMNITDFVDTMQLKLSDLERVGEQGYVKGISHIVINKLKDLDICKRPIHCSDFKRETMYIKDENAWEKDGTKGKLSKMIKHVAHKNQKQIGSWQEENPEYKDSESTKCDEYLKIVGESMNGLTNDDESDGYTNKIIKNIAKEVIIIEE